MRKPSINDLYLCASMVCFVISGCAMQSKFMITAIDEDTLFSIYKQSARLIPLTYFLFNASALLIVYNFYKIHANYIHTSYKKITNFITNLNRKKSK